jgi:Fe-S-cluster containining protein
MNDVALIQIVDAALAEATRKAGRWLACRPGCADCCIGTFEITTLDARRLQEGLAAVDPAVAARIRDRARRSHETDNEPCPVLDPATKTCDLYAWRPLTCRTFGPPVHFRAEALAICDLCFVGATDEQVAGCEVEIDLDPIDDAELTVAQAIAQA